MAHTDGRREPPFLLTADFLRKYDVPGPRYTSYPPAPHFKPGWAEADLLSLVERSNTTGVPNLSFYVHIPFCPKQCLFCGCTTEIGKPGSAVVAYFAALNREMDRILPLLDANRPVSQIHFGGGTPNAAPVKHLAEVVQRLLRGRNLSDGAEIAIECDPNLITRNKLAELREAGVQPHLLRAPGLPEGHSGRGEPRLPAHRTRRADRGIPPSGLHRREPRPHLRSPAPDPRDLRAHRGPDHRGQTRPRGHLQLRPCAVGQGPPEDAGSQGPARRRGQDRDGRGRLRRLFGRRLRAHRDGPLRPPPRRTRPGAGGWSFAPQFPGLLLQADHRTGRGLRGLGHLAAPRRLPAEHQGKLQVHRGDGKRVPGTAGDRRQRGRNRYRHLRPAGQNRCHHPRRGLRQHRILHQQYHLHRWRNRHPALPRHPDRATRRAFDLHRDRLPFDLRPFADQGRIDRFLADADREREPPRGHEVPLRGLPGQRPPDGHPLGDDQRLLVFLPRPHAKCQPRALRHPRRPLDLAGAHHRGLLLPQIPRPADHLPEADLQVHPRTSCT
jgi:hypothetical protein